MTVVLDLSPEAESSLRQFAASEGVTPSDLVSRLLERYQNADTPDATEPSWRAKLRVGEEMARREFAASGKTDEELSEEIETEIKVYRAERAAAAHRTRRSSPRSWPATGLSSCRRGLDDRGQ